LVLEAVGNFTDGVICLLNGKLATKLIFANVSHRRRARISFIAASLIAPDTKRSGSLRASCFVVLDIVPEYRYNKSSVDKGLA